MKDFFFKEKIMNFGVVGRAIRSQNCTPPEMFLRSHDCINRNALKVVDSVSPLYRN